MQIEGEDWAIVIHIEGEDQAPWLKVFRSAFPHRRVLRSDEVDARAIGQVAVAVVWAPPPGFLGQFPNLRQIVSIGAGTDHLSSDPSRPLNVPVLPRQEHGSEINGVVCRFMTPLPSLCLKRMSQWEIVGLHYGS